MTRQKTSRRAADRRPCRGLTVEQAARQASVSERTAYRRLAEDTFRQNVQKARSQMLGQTIGWLSRSGATAVQTLLGLCLNGKSESVKQSASRSILEFLFRGTELIELERRIGASEERAATEGRKRR
jgi:hypothetical protein